MIHKNKQNDRCECPQQQRELQNICCSEIYRITKYRKYKLTSSVFRESKCFFISTFDLVASNSAARLLSLANCVSLLIFLDTSELCELYFNATWKAAKACTLTDNSILQIWLTKIMCKQNRSHTSSYRSKASKTHPFLK